MIKHIYNSILLRNSRILITCLFTLIAGISTGAFYTLLIDANDHIYLNALLSQSLNGSAHLTFHIMLHNILFLLLFFVAGLSIYGSPLTLLLLLFQGISSGLCTILVLDASIAANIIVPTILANIVLSAIYMLSAAISITYALPHLQDSTTRNDTMLEYFTLFAILGFLTLLTSLIQ